MIMQTGDWPDADAYRVACDCHHNDHDLDVWIEVESDKAVREITLTFYKELYTPMWERGFNRFREAFRILFTGSTSKAVIAGKTARGHLAGAGARSLPFRQVGFRAGPTGGVFPA